MLGPPRVPVGPRAHLSDREVQLLVRMAGGMSNGQIGRELHLSEDTVKTYARRLYTSLGVRDRAHAVARGYQQGILLVGDGEHAPARVGAPPMTTLRPGALADGGCTS